VKKPVANDATLLILPVNSHVTGAASAGDAGPAIAVDTKSANRTVRQSNLIAFSRRSFRSLDGSA
jgi:hypothetical protein